MRILKKTALAAVLALAASAGSAFAVPITGMISIAGTASYTPTNVNFTGNGIAFAGTETGSFTAIGTTTNVTLTSFQYNPTLSPAPVTVFSATGNSLTAAFTLATISSFSNSNDQLSINGTGSLSLTGFDTTQGTFLLSTQGGSNTNVTFSATAKAVPEPMSIMLLGTALVGVGLSRRNAKKAA